MEEIEKARTEAPERRRRTGRCIGELLLQLGVAPHTAGFCALYSGSMLLTEQDAAFRQRLNGALYPIVERYAEHGRHSAEHAIRDAVRTGFSGEPGSLRAELFPDGRAPPRREARQPLFGARRTTAPDRSR